MPEEALGVAGTLDSAVGATVVTLCVGGWEVGAAVTLGLAEMVAVRLGSLLELVMELLHPAARQPTATMAISREGLSAECRMLILAHCSWPTAGASIDRWRLRIVAHLASLSLAHTRTV